MGSRTPIEGGREARQRAWRDVNANIAALANRLTCATEPADDAWTFMCECGDGACREMIAVELDAFRAARDRGQLLVAHGHETEHDRVARRHEDYLVVEPD